MHVLVALRTRTPCLCCLFRRKPPNLGRFLGSRQLRTWPALQVTREQSPLKDFCHGRTTVWLRLRPRLLNFPLRPRLFGKQKASLTSVPKCTGCCCETNRAKEDQSHASPASLPETPERRKDYQLSISSYFFQNSPKMLAFPIPLEVLSVRALPRSTGLPKQLNSLASLTRVTKGPNF